MTDNNKDDKIAELEAKLVTARKYFREQKAEITDLKAKLEQQKSPSTKKTTDKRFKPPSISEVAEYAKQNNQNIDAQAFIDFYESKGWMVGKNKMKSWQAATRTWNRNNPSKPTPKSNADEWANAGRMI